MIWIGVWVTVLLSEALLRLRPYIGSYRHRSVSCSLKQHLRISRMLDSEGLREGANPLPRSFVTGHIESHVEDRVS